MRRITKQAAYEPVFEDWLWHVTMPTLAYGATAAAALGMLRAPGPFLFLVAAAVLVLMVTGIHNAWDTTVFIAEGRAGEGRVGGQGEPPAPAQP